MNKRYLFLTFGIILLMMIPFVLPLLTDNITSYWKMDESSGSVLDSLGLNNGTNFGATAGVTGKINTAYQFDGTNDYINFNSNTSVDNIFANGGTVGGWINRTGNLNTNPRILDKSNSDAFTTGWSLWATPESSGNNYSLQFGVGFSGTRGIWNATNKYGVKNQWVFVVMSYNSSNVSDNPKFYINGQLMPTTIALTPVGTYNSDASLNLLMGRNPTADYFNGTLDEFFVYNRILNTDEITELYLNNAGNSYPFISSNSILVSPADDTITTNSSINFTSSYNSSGGTIFNSATYYVWYSNGTLFNSTTVSIPATNVTTLRINNFNLNTYLWNVLLNYDNATGTFTSFATNGNFSFTLQSTKGEPAFNLTTYETASESYSMNITPFGAYTPTSPQINWNGTNYTATLTNLGNGNYSLSYSKIIPTITSASNITFSFNWQTNGVTESSSIYNQTINPIIFTLCNSTYNTPFYNITFKDEGNSSRINASIPFSNFTYYLGDGSITKEYDFTNTTVNNNYTFCVSPTDRTIYVDPYVQYKSGTDYPQRVYDAGVLTITNSTTNLTLYLLSTSQGIYVTFQLVNPASQVIEGVEVTAVRNIGGVDTTVGQGTTGADGGVTFWLNPDFSHTITFVKSGFTTYTTTLTPTQTSYSITMSQSTSSTSNYNQGINNWIYPTNSSLTNDTIYTFGINLTSSFWSLTEYGFNLRLTNGTIITGGTSATSGTLITISYNTTNQTKIYLDYYWLINGTYSNGTVTWVVYNTDKTQWSIATFFKDLTRFLDSGFYGIDNFGRYLIIFIIIFFTIGIMSYKYGLTSPMTISTMTFLIIFFFDVVVGIIPAITIFSGKQVEHLLTIVSGIIMVAMIFRGVKTQT